MATESSETILNGFQINWIKLTNADDGKTIWHEAKDFSDSKEIHEARVPTSILDVRAMLREINFSTKEELKNFRIVQLAKFKGKLLEQWAFTMGPVKPFSTNSWISTIEAAPESQMMPAKVLNGNVTIETEFYDDDEKFATSVIKLFYVYASRKHHEIFALKMFFPIGELCDDILVEVFEHLDAETLKKASLVCKRWSDLIGSSKNTMNKFIWRLKSQHDRRPWSSHWLPNFNEILSLQRRPQAIEVTLMSQEELERFTKISECHGAQVRTFEIKCFMKFDIKEQIKILRNMPMLEKLELYTFAGCEEIQNDELNLIASLKSLQALTIWNTQKSNTNNWEIFKLLRCIDASKIKELRLCNKSSTSYEEPRFEAFDDQSDLIIEFLSAAINLKALRMCETVFLNVFKEKQSQFPLRFLFRLKKFTVDCDIPEFLRPDQPRSTNHDKITKCFLDFLDSQSSSLEEFNGEYNFQREVFEAIFTKLLNVKDLRIKFSILPIDRRFYDNLKPMMKLRAIGSMYQFAEEVAAEGMLKYCPEILKLEEDYFYRFEWLNENSFKGIIKFISIHNPKIEILCVKSIYTKLESFSKFQSLKQVKIDKISDRKLLINFIKINPTIEAISVLHYEGKKLKPKDLHDFVFHPRLSKLKFNWTCQGVKKNLDRFMEKDSKLKSWIVSKVHDRGIYLLFKK